MFGLLTFVRSGIVVGAGENIVTVPLREERLSNDCRKTNTDVITPTNQKEQTAR